MLKTVEIGWTVLFNDYNGTKSPAIVTKAYSEGDPNSNLDLHVIGIKNNASYSRGKLNVPYGINALGHWEYSNVRTIQIDSNDLPTDGQGLIYNASSDNFETENITTLAFDADGGTF